MGCSRLDRGRSCLGFSVKLGSSTTEGVSGRKLFGWFMLQRLGVLWEYEGMANILAGRRKPREASKSACGDTEREAVGAFKEHWADVLRRARIGRPLWKRLWQCFEADSNKRSKLLAEKFFGVSHARRMCRLTERQIRRRLSCYLPRAIEFASGEFSSAAEEAKFIRELVTGIYVIFDSKQCSWPEAYDEHFEGLSVSTFPAPVGYDDWYERSVGSSFFMCGTSLLMKSTGEKFGVRELKWLGRAIQSNIDGEGPDELYGIEIEALAASRLWIKIYELDREDYVCGVMGQVGALTERQLKVFLEGIVEWLLEAGEFTAPAKTRRGRACDGKEQVVGTEARLALMRRLLGNMQKIPREEILRKVDHLLSRKKCSNRTVREVENIANRILGVSLRDYHCGVSW